MHGPSHTSRSCGATPAPWQSAETVASSTPAASPRQPACAAATARPSRAQNSAGRQSATRTAQARPRSVVHAASAGGRSASASASASAAVRRKTLAPCTCRSHIGRAPSSAARRLRFSATSRGASPVAPPRLSDSHGPRLTPPRRSVMAAPMPAGAGQSGRSSAVTRSRGSARGAWPRRRRAPCRPRRRASPAARARAAHRSAGR